LNTDASSLYVMLRNISGSVGISLSTAMVQERTQVYRAYLAGHLTPFDQPYNALVEHLQSVLTGRFPPGALRQTAEGLVNLMLTQQAAILAYIDVFALSSVLAFCMIPIIFLFRGSTARTPAAGAAH
jgi:DHA2 family multidrug resistance protein